MIYLSLNYCHSSNHYDNDDDIYDDDDDDVEMFHYGVDIFVLFACRYNLIIIVALYV